MTELRTVQVAETLVESVERDVEDYVFGNLCDSLLRCG